MTNQVSHPHKTGKTLSLRFLNRI